MSAAGPRCDGKAVLVVGLGSIGCRHRDVVADLGAAVRTVSRRKGEGDFASIEAAFASEKFAAAVVATETSRHQRDLTDILTFGGGCTVLVEKPLFADLHEHKGSTPAAPVYVGYVLRFHAVVRIVRDWLIGRGEPVVAARLAVGQRLSGWRPGRDVRTVYSAHAGSGGGILRDLSHELDLVRWLFGMPERLTAIGGRYGDETVDADDAWSILMACPAAAQVGVSLNGLDPLPCRALSVSTATANLHADLLRGTVETPDGLKTVPVERNQSFRDMWSAVLLGGPAARHLSTYDDGLAVMAMIAACETAARRGDWVQPSEVAP